MVHSAADRDEVWTDGRVDGARAHGRGGYRRDDRLPQVFLQPLVPAEKEHPVLDDGSSDGAAVLVSRERRRFAALVEVVGRVHPAVAEELEARPVQLVGA